MSNQMSTKDNHEQRGVYAPLQAVQPDNIAKTGFPGITNIIAISRTTVNTEHLWVAHVTVLPGSGLSPVHHHGANEAVFYILKGQATFFFGDGLRQRLDVKDGEFVFIPSFAIHAEANLGNENAEMLAIQSASKQIAVHVADVQVPQDLLEPNA